MSASRGLFITFEGIDGCGKSTQIQRLRAFLESEGICVEVIREPGGTQIGEQIRNMLLDKTNTGMSYRTELLLFEGARAQIVQERINPALASGKVVIADRFYDSTSAYQGYARGLNLQDIDVLNIYATGGLEPHLTFLMDVPVEEAAGRVDDRLKESDRLEKEGRVFMSKVRAGYRALAQQHDRIILIDATAPIDSVSDRIKHKVLEVLNT